MSTETGVTGQVLVLARGEPVAALSVDFIHSAALVGAASCTSFP